MKIIQEKKPFEDWSLQVECNGLNWNQDNKIPCGSILDINAKDLLKRKWFKYPNNDGVNYGIVCPVCKCFTEINDNILPDNLKKMAKDFN